MPRIEIKYAHIWLGIALYASCLFFTAYYLREIREPQAASAALAIGWLGILDGHFSWYANPLFIIAIIINRKHPTLSLLLGVLALLLVLSFLNHKRIVVSEAPTYANITAYGIGYFLWALSIAVFLTGQFIAATQCFSSVGKIIFSYLFVVLFSTTAYASYYFIGKESLYNIFRDRELNFNRLCKTTESFIKRKPTDITGVYIDSVRSGNYRPVKNNTFSQYDYGQISYLRYYQFEETKPYSSKETNLPYIRRYSNEPNKRIPVSELQANYEIVGIETTADLPKYLDIFGQEVIVKSRVTNEVIAKSTYVVNEIDKKICAPELESDGTYSVTLFLFRALGLNQSNFEK